MTGGVRSGPLAPVRLPYGERCRRCTASIIWTDTTRGARRAVDALPHIDGTIALTFHEDGRRPTSEVLTGLFRLEAEFGSLYVDHHATCTSPADGRRRP